MPDQPLSILFQPTPLPARDDGELRLLVELPSPLRVFFGNLRDLAFPHRYPPLLLTSPPTLFWPDVFVKRGLPWRRFLESTAYHTVVVSALIVASRFAALHPHPVPPAHFDHSQVIYYEPAEYLPPLDTRQPAPGPPEKSDPELSKQAIISVPPAADNKTQTIVTAPKIKLNHEVRMPNVVAWSDQPKKPVGPPLTPAASLTRLSPQLASPVMAPPPEAMPPDRRRNSPSLPASVVAPPPDVTARRAAFSAPQPAVIAPPPTLDSASARSLGELNIGPSPVVAPAPQLPVAVQRAIPGAASGPLDGASVLPPPPMASAGPSGGGRMVALNLHPDVGAPPDPPAGNRMGHFAATPEGHAGASGTPGSKSSSPDAAGNGGKGNTRAKSDGLPSGLYVGNAAQPSKTAPVASDPKTNAGPPAAPPNVAAASPAPRPGGAPAHVLQPDTEARLSEVERAIFVGRRFYSDTINMPNLNSAGGSWVIRFAELNPKSQADTVPLSPPVATRKVDPAYPIQLMRQNVSGTVILSAIIHADGTVDNVRILRSVDERIDQFASRAIRQWQFQPAMKNGTPVDVEATFHIPFRPSPRSVF